MIYGIGTDICDIRRIRASFGRHGERFAEKILSGGELTVWRRRSARWPERGLRYLATRFSAKEAFSKAIGTGMSGPMQWRLCEIAKPPRRRAASGAARRAPKLVCRTRPARAHQPHGRERIRRQLLRR